MQSRIGTALTVYAFAVLGLFLLVAPWTPVWAQAAYGLLPRGAEPWALSGWVRGIVTGLGAVDLVVALQIAGELWSESRERER